MPRFCDNGNWKRYLSRNTGQLLAGSSGRERKGGREIEGEKNGKKKGREKGEDALDRFIDEK